MAFVRQLCSEWLQFNPLLSSVTLLSSPKLLGTPPGDPGVKGTSWLVTGCSWRGLRIEQFSLFIHLDPIDIGLVPILLHPVDGKYNSPTHSIHKTSQNTGSRPYDFAMCTLWAFEPVLIGALRLADCIPNLHSNSDPEGERKVQVHERERDPGESSGVESCILGNRSLKAGWRIYSGMVLY